jgi:hypothetical protein
VENCKAPNDAVTHVHIGIYSYHLHTKFTVWLRMAIRSLLPSNLLPGGPRLLSGPQRGTPSPIAAPTERRWRSVRAYYE